MIVKKVEERAFGLAVKIKCHAKTSVVQCRKALNDIS